jgi:hypothetical protein
MWNWVKIVEYIIIIIIIIIVASINPSSCYCFEVFKEKFLL